MGRKDCFLCRFEKAEAQPRRTEDTKEMPLLSQLTTDEGINNTPTPQNEHHHRLHHRNRPTYPDRQSAGRNGLRTVAHLPRAPHDIALQVLRRACLDFAETRQAGNLSSQYAHALQRNAAGSPVARPTSDIIATGEDQPAFDVYDIAYPSHPGGGGDR